MNWIKELYDTYENCIDFVGRDDGTGHILLPISYIQVNFQIDCVLSVHGDLLTASVIDKSEAVTMIPATIDSANRTSSPVAHPLFDKLIYMAKDLPAYSDVKSYYELYRSQLFNWIHTDGTPDWLTILYMYLEKGRLISDLIDFGILKVDGNGKLIEKWQGAAKEKPLLYKVISGSIESALVRFSLLTDDGEFIQLWEEKAIQDSFQKYYLPQIEKTDFCLITGEMEKIGEKHPAYLRFPGDSAKLISSQDNLGFKYNGRCLNASDVLSIGYIPSQKAHNALKWLIRRQGKVESGFVTLTWGTMTPNVPTLEASMYDYFGRELEPILDTELTYAVALKKTLAGYQSKNFFDPKENVVVMCLDAATTGRLSILYYQSMKGSQYLQRIFHWYETCSWQGIPYYRKDKNTDKQNKYYIAGSPTIYQILNAVYGDADSDSTRKLKKNAKEKIIHCMVDSGKLPKEFVSKVFQRFLKLIVIKEYYGRLDFLAVASAIMRKYYNDLSSENKEIWKMNLDEENKGASYLWGRLLAYLVWVERVAHKVSKITNRDTNAERYTKQFQLNPMKTWTRLVILVKPYRNKLLKNEYYKELEMYEKEMNQIMNDLSKCEDREAPLKDIFLMAYAAQLCNLEKNNHKKDVE